MSGQSGRHGEMWNCSMNCARTDLGDVAGEELTEVVLGDDFYHDLAHLLVKNSGGVISRICCSALRSRLQDRHEDKAERRERAGQQGSTCGLQLAPTASLPRQGDEPRQRRPAAPK